MPAYKLSIFKSWGVRNRSASWVNTYDFVSDAPLESPEWVTCVNAMVFGEQTIHMPQVNFLHATVSTWNPEATYRYENLRAIPLNAVGAYNLGAIAEDLPEGVTGALDLNYALQYNKDAVLGRNGHNFYRGCLSIFDVTADSAGKPSLSVYGAARFGGATQVMMNQRFNERGTAGFRWVMMPDPRKAAEQAGDGETNPDGGVEGLSVRDVGGLLLGGVVLLPRDHKYYDKITPKKVLRVQQYLAALPPAEDDDEVIDGEVVEP